MPTNRTHLWLIAAALIGLPACGASGGASPWLGVDGGVSLSDTGMVTVDAGAADAAPPDAGTPTPFIDAGTAGREDTDIACADFLDDDTNMLVDCADTTGCGSRPICCVGSTSSACCTAPTTLAAVLDLDACTDPLAVCASGMVTFGTPLPTLASSRADGGACAAGGSMAPQGGDRSDGGLVASQALDTTIGTVALESTLGVSGTPASTLDAVGVGLTAQQDLSSASLAHVRPTVAVVLSATDHTLRAVAGDVAFPTHDLDGILDTACTDLEVRIVTSPSGTFDAYYRRVGASTWTDLERGRPYEPAISVHVVAYGRSTNPGIDGVHAWVRSVSAGRVACDVLDPVRSTTGVFSPAPTPGPAIRSVSRVGPIAVYEQEGAIYVAGVDGAGQLRSLGRPDQDRVLVPGEAPFIMSAVEDPELAAIGDNRRLLFTGVAADGTRSIGYLDFDTDLTNRVTMSSPRQLLTPSALGIQGVDGPAYFETVDATGAMHRFLVFRAIVSATRSEIRAVELVGDSAVLGVNLEAADVSRSGAQFYTSASPLTADEAIYTNRAEDPTAFDHDEIAAPEVVVYRDVVRVFFAARRGARWSIGMLRSPDFAHFQLAYPDAVLSSRGSGFDAVSVSDPDASVDAAGLLSLYYTASDGTIVQPGLATQEVP